MEGLGVWTVLFVFVLFVLVLLEMEGSRIHGIYLGELQTIF
jgi:hypothetical protein